MPRKTVEERFWAKVHKTKACWLWTAGATGSGYGAFSFRGRTTVAHRVSWMLGCGGDPGELFVLHRCDTPRCVNPKHLFLGTKGDNNRDRAAKGRSFRPHGELDPMAKLTLEQVREIRRSSATQRELAKAYGVHQSQISRIQNGRGWAHAEAS